MKKLLFMFLSLFFIVFFSVPPITFAQQPTPTAPSQAKPSTWYNQDLKEWYTKVYDDSNPTEIFGERYTAAQVQWIFYSILTLPFTKAKSLTNCSFTGDLSQCKDVVEQAVAEMETLYKYAEKRTPKNDSPFINNSSLSGVNYLRNRLSKITLVNEADAQGFGYTALSGVIVPAWSQIRNFSYTLLVLVIIYFAFMIMFRQKVGAQTALNIQQALPKLIVTILLITFSYAIAGFMVDIMYVVSGLIMYLVEQALNGNVVISNYTWNFFVGELGGIGIIFFIVLYLVFFILAGFVSLVAFFLSGITQSIAGIAVLSVVTPILLLIGLPVLFLLFLGILIMIIWNLIKIVWMLIKTVAYLYLQIIFSPLILLGSNFSNNLNFMSWIKGLAGNLAVFPVIGLLMWVSIWFLGQAVTAAIISTGAIPSNFINFFNDVFGLTLPTVTAWSPPLLGRGWEGLIFIGASLSVLFMIPKAAQLAKEIVAGQGIKAAPDFKDLAMANMFTKDRISSEMDALALNPQNNGALNWVTGLGIPGVNMDNAKKSIGYVRRLYDSSGITKQKEKPTEVRIVQ